MRRFPLATLPFALAFGCSANVSPSGAPDAETTPLHAVVTVERTTSAAGTRGEATARFIRVSAGAADIPALRLAGAISDLPPLGQCVNERPFGGPTSPFQKVELVDVGAVSVEMIGPTVSLVGRKLPEIMELVSGVIYASHPRDVETFPTSTPYRVIVAGSSTVGVDPFTMEATAPEEPTRILLNNRDATPGALVIDGSPKDLTWEARNATDRILIELAPANATGLRCLFSDSGRAAFPPSAWESSGEGTLTLHRLHGEKFDIQSGGTGEIQFDFARVIAYRRP